MTRHLADHRSPSDGTRLRRFLEVERLAGEEGSHPASRTLARRPATRSPSRRTAEFLRVERGQEA